MPRGIAKRETSLVKASPGYWDEVLRRRGLLSELNPVLEEEQQPIARDPRLAQFLREAGRYGAPKMADFLKLPGSEKAYWLKAFSLWLEEVKKMEKRRKQSSSEPSPVES